jgi:hypothetical protein
MGDIEKGIFQPNFYTFTNTDIVRREPLGGDYKGNQNAGFTYVQFKDGSRGIEKQMKDWYGNKTGRLYKAEVLATQEYLASRVGEVMNAPIRDCLFTSDDAKTIIMPYVLGKSGEELGGEGVPENEQGVALNLFDYLTANSDRRPKNLLFTDDNRIVGIDHALCNFRPRTPSPELVSQLWNFGVNAESLNILKPKLENLVTIFGTLGMLDKFQNMIGNLDLLIKDLEEIAQYATITKNDDFESRLGRCYELAGSYAPTQPGSTLIHGSIQGFGYPRIGHAWVQLKDGSVWEPTTDTVYPEKTFRSYFNAEITKAYDPASVAKGDVAGHEFHGNQYTGGFVALTSTTIDKKLGNKEILGGIQNTGFTKVRLSDGSIGIIKHGMKEEEANREVLSADIARAIDAPIRDAVIVKQSPTTNRCDVLHPFVAGETLAQTFGSEDIGAEETLGLVKNELGPQALKDLQGIDFADSVMGNSDVHLGNIMQYEENGVTRLVGIDHGLSIMYPESPEELVSKAEALGIDSKTINEYNTHMEDVKKTTNVIPALRDDFSYVMENWSQFYDLWKRKNAQK